MERYANIGYLAMKKETTTGTPVIPDVYTPLYDETFATNTNYQSQQPIYGQKYMSMSTLRGQRDHGGELVVLAEPNTTAHFINSLLVKGTTTGSDPYTHPFNESITTNPKSYTIDVAVGNVVKRFWGFQSSSITPDWQDNELRHRVKGSALGSFQARSVASISTTAVTLDTTYDSDPTKGLVAGDLVRIYKASDGSTLDSTVASVDSATVVTLDDSASAFAAGDILHLRPATPNFSLLETFKWAKTEFRFADTAANALSATQVQVEQGSEFEVMHMFNDDAGEKRSGSFDPASLARKGIDSSLTVKKFFDTPEDIQYWNDMDKRSCVIRHFAGSSNQYEYRVTFHNLVVDTPVPTAKSDDILYSDQTFKTNYDTSDGKGISLTVINGLSSV